MKGIRKYSGLAMVCGVLLAGAVFAQAPGIKRNIVQRGDVSFPGHEAVIASVEIAPGASAGRHTHPGEEISYVMDGEGELMITGQPTRKIKAGDGFIVPANTIHDAHNTGSKPLKLAAVYYVEKGKPMATPAP
ncbi:MAG TPA: cupin domain-containing protein [Bryobacteraceae bacterium]|jgi:quercetin dioxygenase-like cupin family protein|nr:cupin domain-containing protein [Bryobacteraceae bacterium]